MTKKLEIEVHIPEQTLKLINKRPDIIKHYEGLDEDALSLIEEIELYDQLVQKIVRKCTFKVIDG